MTSALVLVETFLSFKDLAGAYAEGVDYQIHLSAGLKPKIAVVAPHGGAIEFSMSWVAAAIVGREFSFYSSEGIRAADNYAALHLRSERFDEPRCLEFYGTDASNICNRGRSRAGVQLELTSTLRKSPEAVAGVMRAVRNVLIWLADAADGPREPQAGVI